MNMNMHPYIPNEEIYGNTNPLSGRYFSSGEPIPNWNYNPEATIHQGPEISYYDVNQDGVLNVIDIVAMVNHIIGVDTFTQDQIEIASYGDGVINVVDIVELVNIILGIGGED